MRLGELARGSGLRGARLVGDATVEVAGLTADSRTVEPGWLFVAYRGKERDLHDFVPDALRRGAAGVCVERADAVPPGASAIVVRPGHGRAAEGRLAAAFYGHPARRLKIVGVTGTDGKTTTSTLIHAVLEAAGRRTGLVTTVNARIGQETFETGLHTTTPRALDIQRLLARMVEADVEWVVLETTSHALAQRRTVGVDYDVAVLTNLTREHLDEHGSFGAYRAAKARLFAALGTSPRKPGVGKVAVVNADDPAAADFANHPADAVIRFGFGAGADVRALDVALTSDGCYFAAATPLGQFPVRCCLPGRYNVANALAAVAVGVALHLPADAIAAGIERVEGIAGRMERLDRGQPFTAIVDFAHTPNALDHALRHARTLVAPGGRLIAVFGCAGERDAGKRPLMGEIAGRLADLTILTDEDRRREDVRAIMAQIAAGVQQAGGVEGRTFLREDDRGAAIRRAVALARPGDVVIVCGKGHERSMCFGTEERPWSDQDALLAAIEAAYPVAAR